MRRIQILLALIAVVAAMMVFAAPAIADTEITGSGGNSVVGSLGGGEVDIDSSGGSLNIG